MGWPMVPSADLYAGGPAYPLSSLGVRLRGQPTGVTDAARRRVRRQSAGRSVQRRSPVARQHAVGRQLQSADRRTVHRRDAVRAEPARHRRHGDHGSPVRRSARHIQAGLLVSTRAGFPDQRFGSDRLSLADPHSNGNAAAAEQQFSIYGVVDQMIWRPDPKTARVRSACSRALMGAPGRPQPDQLQRQCRCRRSRRRCRAGTTIRSASASASPRSAARPRALDRDAAISRGIALSGARQPRPSSR